jgi:AraC-like DNA-binding protein
VVDWRVLATERLLREACSRKGLTLRVISRRYNVSAHYLGKVFKVGTGFTFHQYLRRVRIDVACSLLARSNRAVEEVGHLVGYDDESNFLRVFRSVVGLTPYEYRKSTRSVPVLGNGETECIVSHTGLDICEKHEKSTLGGMSGSDAEKLKSLKDEE